MRTIHNLLILLSLGLLTAAQTATPPPHPSAPANSTSTVPILADLNRLQAAASQANVELGYMRIDKWKADRSSKQQAEANADSVQRNLTTALPGLIANVCNAPQDVSAQFKLYRNLNALYDVFASLTESAGAFGPKSDYAALAQPLSVIDSVRRNLGNNLESLTSATQSELNQLRAQVRTLKQQAGTASPPKQVIVDDAEPAKKTSSHKKKPTSKPTGENSSSSSANSGASATAKQQ